MPEKTTLLDFGSLVNRESPTELFVLEADQGLKDAKDGSLSIPARLAGAEAARKAAMEAGVLGDSRPEITAKEAEDAAFAAATDDDLLFAVLQRAKIIDDPVTAFVAAEFAKRAARARKMPKSQRATKAAERAARNAQKAKAPVEAKPQKKKILSVVRQSETYLQEAQEMQDKASTAEVPERFEAAFNARKAVFHSAEIKFISEFGRCRSRSLLGSFFPRREATPILDF